LSASVFTIYIAVSMLVIYLTSGLIAQTAFVLVMGCCAFLSVVFVAIICQESVPSYIAATTTAIGMATGELIGTSLMPPVLGWLGDLYGLRTIFLVAAITLLIAFFLTFGLTETGKAYLEKSKSCIPLPNSQGNHDGEN
jgi:sugar phosphate permease